MSAPEAPRRFRLFPTSLAQAVGQSIKPIYKKHGFAEHRILTEWAAIVGEELAAVSVPQKLRTRRGSKEQGTLHVLVAGARALELQHQSAVILERIAAYFGYRAVGKLALTQTSAPLLRPAAEAAPIAHAVGDWLPLAEAAADPELRTALLGLARAARGG